MEYQPGRLKPCPDCGQDVDTWLSGTSAAMTTPRGVVCGWCYSENGMNPPPEPVQRPGSAPVT